MAIIALAVWIAWSRSGRRNEPSAMLATHP